MKQTDIFTMTESFKRGEEKGFRFFFNSLYASLVFYSWRFSQDRESAEDIAEESFIKIWERHESFSHPNVIKSWLYTTVRNATLNKMAEEKRQNKHKDIIAAEKQYEYQESPLAGIVITETIMEVRKALKVLPTECRKIFEMLYIENMSIRETANKLKIGISTVKNQKYRGLEILRKKSSLMAA